MNRCTGHCCAEYQLPKTPAELADPANKYEDGAAVAEMSIPIGTRVRSLDWVVDPDTRAQLVALGAAWASGGPIYRCKHLKDDGDCGNYEHRPAMCRRYPYEGRCEFVDCTWAAAREGR